jgi:nitrogen fixation protein NifU and related proteins
MPDLKELYQQVILDHNKNPQNFHKLEDANRKAEGYNTLCGDHITLYARLENDVITDVGFEGTGCAIFKASASLMTQALKGKTKAEAETLFDSVHKMLTGELDPSANGNQLGKLAVFSGVCEFPVRVKCATLAWHTLKAALEAKTDIVSTE